MVDDKAETPGPGAKPGSKQASENGSVRTRFKKGNSARKGKKRPPRPDPMREFQKVLESKIEVSETGERMTIRKALLLKLREEGIGGARWATRLIEQVVTRVPPAESDIEQEVAEAEQQELERNTKLAGFHPTIKERVLEDYRRRRARNERR